MYTGLWHLSVRHVSAQLHPHCTPGPSPCIYKRKVQGPHARGVIAREDGLTDRLPLSLSFANACNPYCKHIPPLAQDNTSRGFAPLCPVSRQPI
jgi:hypothetical protein